MNQNIILRKLTRNILLPISASGQSKVPDPTDPGTETEESLGATDSTQRMADSQSCKSPWTNHLSERMCGKTVDLFHAIKINGIDAFKLSSAFSFPYDVSSWNEHIGRVWCARHQLCPSTSTITQETSASSATSTKHLGPICSGLGTSCSSPGVCKGLCVLCGIAWGTFFHGLL